MTARTLALSDFLLARIAEDEESAPYVFAEQFTPARLLAECEAKRRIVEWHTNCDGGMYDDCCEVRLGPLVLNADPEVSAGTDMFGQLSIRQSIGTQAYIGCATLMMLALPYADHPDYREEWRP